MKKLKRKKRLLQRQNHRYLGVTDEQRTNHKQVHVKTVSEDERYSKYFKMLKMGVPLQVFLTLLDMNMPS